MWAEPWSPMPSLAVPTSPRTASATSATPRAAGPAGPSSTRTGSASSGGRRSSSTPRPASASTTRSASASRARTRSPRWPAPPGCTCSTPTASPSPRSTSPRPPATRPASSSARPGAWSAAARSCSTGSSLTATSSSARATAGSCGRLSSDAALQHGLNPSANIVDELHAHKSAELYTALTTGTGAREQPFTLWITTAGVAGEGILAELFESMFSGTGELEDRGSLLIYRDRVNGTLIYWYGAPRDADIEDPAVWYAANPVSLAPRRQVPGRPVRAASGSRRAPRVAPLPPQPVRRLRGRLAPRRRLARHDRRPAAQPRPPDRGRRSTGVPAASRGRSSSRSARGTASW